MRSIADSARWLLGALVSFWVLGANVSPAFTPVRAELGDARGFSRGLLNFVVLENHQPFLHAPVWSFIVVAIGFLLLVAARPVGWRFAKAGAVLGAALLIAVASSPYVTSYRIVLAPRTFVLAVLLLWAPRAIAVSVGDRVRRFVGLADGASQPGRQRMLGILAAGMLGAAFFASAMLQTLAGYGGSYSGFLHMSRGVAERTPFLAERPDLGRSLVVFDKGYDGQFMYVIAFDPFLQRYADQPQAYRAFVDAPPYRYGRIGFPLLARLLAVGQPSRFPVAMMWLLVMSHFMLAAVLASLAVRHGLSPAVGLVYLAMPGFMASLMSALPESIAAAGLVGGYLCWDRRQVVGASACFAAALLVRETTAVLVIAIVIASLRAGARQQAAIVAASLVPVAAWRVFVASRLFADWGWQALLANPGDLGVPFAGLVALVLAGIARTQPASEIVPALVFPIVLTAAAVLAVWLLALRRGPLEIAAVGYGAVAVSLRYDKIWSHVPSGERGTFELFLCLLLLLITSRDRPMPVRAVLTGLFVVLGAYTLALAPDAATSRAALLLIR